VNSIDSVFTLGFEFVIHVLEIFSSSIEKLFSQLWRESIFLLLTLKQRNSDRMVLPENIDWEVLIYWLWLISASNNCFFQIFELLTNLILRHWNSFTISPTVAANWLQQVNWWLFFTFSTIIYFFIRWCDKAPIVTIFFVRKLPSKSSLAKYIWQCHSHSNS